jgi:hypothetical protein
VSFTEQNTLIEIVPAQSTQRTSHQRAIAAHPARRNPNAGLRGLLGSTWTTAGSGGKGRAEVVEQAENRFRDVPTNRSSSGRLR